MQERARLRLSGLSAIAVRLNHESEKIDGRRFIFEIRTLSSIYPGRFNGRKFK